MNDALLELSRPGGATDEPLLADALLARRINLALGGAVVGPWDVGQLPDDVIEGILSIERIGTMQAGRQKIEASMQAWRENHPNYRKAQ